MRTDATPGDDEHEMPISNMPSTHNQRSSHHSRRTLRDLPEFKGKTQAEHDAKISAQKQQRNEGEMINIVYP